MPETKRPTQAAEGHSTLRPDIIAGLTAAAVVLPKAMAYAAVAGLPVAIGLYTAFVPMIIYALLGTSRVLSVSSTTTLAILAATQLGIVVPDGDPAKLLMATATLTAMTGAILVIASLLRLGFVANFISSPVLTGFKAGIGLVIVLDQVPKLLGIHITKQGFFYDAISIVHHLPDTSLITLAVAAATLLVLIGMERLWPHSPAPLVAVGGGIAASWFFGFGGEGVTGVSPAPGPQTIFRRLSEAPPVLQAHLHCDFDGHRTGVGEEHLVEVRWCDVDEQSPEASGGFVRQSAEHDMAHLAELPCGGGVEHGIAVAVNGGPPRAHPVDQSAAVGERQDSPLRRVDDQRTSRRGKRSVRMPEDIGIDGGDVMGIKSGCEHGCTLTIELNGVQVWSEK